MSEGALQKFKLVANLEAAQPFDIESDVIDLGRWFARNESEEISDVHVSTPSGGTIQIRLFILASSWNEASTIGKDLMGAALAYVGIVVDAEESTRPERGTKKRHVSKSGTQLALA